MTKSMLSRRTMLPSVFPSLGRDLDQLNASIRRMFDNPFAMTNELLSNAPQSLGWVPPVEISETPDALVVTAELPGMDAKDVHVALEGDVLTVRGEKSEERTEKDEERQFHLVERSYGSFQRAFALPRSIDADKVTARFDKGVLTVTLEKTKEAKKTGREIAVNAT
jgi:HSP20 family protein